MKRIHVVQRTLPYISLQVSLAAGSAKDPPGKEGLARLTGAMLTRGGRRFSQELFSEELDFLGTSLGVSTGNETVQIGADCATRNLDHLMELAGDALLSPAFLEEELRKTIRRTVAEMSEARDSDSGLTSRFMRQLLFRGHPYAHPTRGFEASVSSLTTADLREFYEQHYTAARLCVGTAGDLSSAQAGRQVLPTLKALPKGGRVAATVPPPPFADGHRVLLIAKPKRTQANVAVGQLAFPGSDPRLMPFGVAATGFGGTFTSVLVREIREKRGWSYGVGAGLVPGSVTGVFQARWAPQTADTVASVALTLELLDDFARNGPPEEDLRFAKEYLINQYPFLVETPVRRMEVEMNAHLVGKPEDYLERYVERVRATSLEDAFEAVSSVLRPNSQVIVVVGEASLEKPLSKLPGVSWFRKLPHTWDGPLPD